MTPALRNFLSAPGIVLKEWAPVFDAVCSMPPIIAYKIRSKKVNVKVALPDGEVLDLLCKTGNRVASVKRKIEFRTEFGDVLLDNKRTLLDYGIGNGSRIVLKVESAIKSTRRGSTARESLLNLDASELAKELTNPELSKEERGKIRRLQNKSIHLALINDELINPSAMTLESYQEENGKLREELQRANMRIEQLERELATESSKSPKKSKVFGSWRRSKK